MFRWWGVNGQGREVREPEAKDSSGSPLSWNRVTDSEYFTTTRRAEFRKCEICKNHQRGGSEVCSSPCSG